MLSATQSLLISLVGRRDLAVGQRINERDNAVARHENEGTACPHAEDFDGKKQNQSGDSDHA